MKNQNHQNKINRMCIKHGNLQCFLSMSFNVFNTTLGSDTFPPSRGRPWGGGYHIYIYVTPFSVVHVNGVESHHQPHFAPPGVWVLAFLILRPRGLSLGGKLGKFGGKIWDVSRK